MAKKETNEKFKTMIGGQALIEGIMMMGPDKCATVVRNKEGIKTKVEPRKKTGKFSVKKIPFVRGIFNFCASMKTGVSALMYSADVYAADEDEAPAEKQSKLDAWLEKKLSSEKAQSVVITLAVVMGILFSVALFILLPSLLGEFIERWVTNDELIRNLLEGVLRIVIFLAYMFLISRMEDMKRVFSYHGAEHKTIHCFEHGLALNAANAQLFPTLHVRCGTAFLIMVMLIAIFVYTVLGAPINALVDLTGITQGPLRFVLVVLTRILLMPVIAGVSYEITVQWAGKRPNNPLVRVILWPGMQMQRLTTNPPDDSMVECAIAAMELVLAREELEAAKKQDTAASAA